jgi:hypothetical protein
MMMMLLLLMMNVEQSVEWELAGKTEVFGENLPQCNFDHLKSHMIMTRIRRLTA